MIIWLIDSRNDWLTEYLIDLRIDKLIVCCTWTRTWIRPRRPIENLESLQMAILFFLLSAILWHLCVFIKGEAVEEEEEERTRQKLYHVFNIFYGLKTYLYWKAKWFIFKTIIIKWRKSWRVSERCLFDIVHRKDEIKPIRENYGVNFSK